jgi:LysM repeat protein
MGYWGWRPLLSTLFLCVWVTGCNITSVNAPMPTPTYLPQVTLTLRQLTAPTPAPSPSAPPTPTKEPATVHTAEPQVYIVRPGDTLLGIALDYNLNVDDLIIANSGIDPLALQVGQTLAIPPRRLVVAAAHTLVPLHLSPPTCTDLITGSVLCLGQVSNHQNQALAGVRVQVDLLAADGSILDTTQTGIEQAIILPAGAAPYSVIFAAPSQPHEHSSVTLRAAVPAHRPLPVIPLDIRDEQVQVSAGRYQVTATLRNPLAQPTGPVRVVLTVLDAADQIAGFRVQHTPDNLEANAQQTITLTVLTRSTAQHPLRHQLYAEAGLGN